MVGKADKPFTALDGFANKPSPSCAVTIVPFTHYRIDAVYILWQTQIALIGWREIEIE
jgi:hypothetical protein